MPKLVFARHGESEWNLANLFTGWADVDLSENGTKQAIEAGKLIKEAGIEFDIAYTSVLKRAIKTTNLALEYSDQLWVPVVKSWRLNERHYGGLTGLNKADAAAKHGDEQVHIWRRSYDVLPPGVEFYSNPLKEVVYLKQEKIVVGYARVSTQRQSLRRQIENLKTAYPNIVIVAEVYTGSTDNRPKWKKLMRQCRAGNVSKLVFDEVSRFSRNAEEAIVEYKELYSLGIELEFLKEPHINSKIYRDASERKIEISTDSMDSETAQLINTVIGGLNDYLLSVAEKQIFLAFDHAQKERELLSKRTSEGLKQAKLMGSKVGRQPGQKLITKKQKRAKRIIRNHYELFGGELTATQCFTLAQITKSTFYRYLNEMREEDKEKGIIWDDEIIAEKIDRGEADPKKIIQVIKANKENNMTGRKL